MTLALALDSDSDSDSGFGSGSGSAALPSLVSFYLLLLSLDLYVVYCM